MINSGSIKATDGKMLINKLNDALSNIARGKTKTAINDLNTFINKVNSLVKTGKIKKDQGQKLIDDVNAIIAKLKGAKSDETEFDISDAGLSHPVQISESKLGVIYPNPFSESITINYEIAESKVSADKVLIRIYDISGRLVGTLVNKNMQSGRYSTLWSGRYDRGGPAPFGTYFVRFKAGNTEEVREIMLVR
jgi:polyhydroxyalkanoate synthesis regulator phasin